MADRNGYIGRAPGDSSVTVARQTFSPTGVTTDFTFASGYTSGYFDVFINGVKMIEGSDYTSTDGSTFSVLNGGATSGDVIEGVAYKAFNAASVSNANGNFTVGGNLTVNGSATFAGAGTSVAFATTAFALSGTPDVTVNDITARNITGVAATFTGVVTYEDVTNIDSVGIVTAQGGLDVTGGNVTIGTGSTVGFGSTAFFRDNAYAVFGDDEDLKIYHDGTRSYIADVGAGPLWILGNQVQIRDNDGTEDLAKFVKNAQVELFYNNSKKLETTTDGVVITGIATATGVDATGIVTATSFEGSGANLTNLPASGDSNDITASLFL